jgi:hypothetical protein
MGGEDDPVGQTVTAKLEWRKQMWVTVVGHAVEVNRAMS